jgi:hypothetical protein
MVERRKAPRVRVTTNIHAKVKAFLDASLVDFSETGALLKVDHPLLPKAVCDLRLSQGEENLTLHATVRRCSVAGHVLREDGQRVLMYQAALEFSEGDRALAKRFANALAPSPPGQGALDVLREE